MSFETTITHNIMSYFKGLGSDCAIVEKVKGEAESAGRADINGCYLGRSMRIEVKTPDNRNKPSKIQLWDLLRWNKAGAICMVVYSVETVQTAIEHFHGDRHDYTIYPEKNNCKSIIMYPYCGITYEALYHMYYKGDADEVQD